MKYLISALISIYTINGFSYACPSYLSKKKEARSTYTWLNKFKDTKNLHGCQVEITLCDINEESNDKNPIGEVMIVTPDQREAYISIDFPLKKNRKFKTKVKSYARALYYRKKDRYYEEENGRTEVWQFEMRTLWDDPSILDHIDIGIYQTNNQLNQPNGNDSRWYNCKRED